MSPYILRYNLHYTLWFTLHRYSMRYCLHHTLRHTLRYGSRYVTLYVTAHVTHHVTRHVTDHIAADVTPNVTANATANDTRQVTANVTRQITVRVTAHVTRHVTANVTVPPSRSLRSVIQENMALGVKARAVIGRWAGTLMTDDVTAVANCTPYGQRIGRATGDMVSLRIRLIPNDSVAALSLGGVMTGEEEDEVVVVVVVVVVVHGGGDDVMAGPLLARHRPFNKWSSHVTMYGPVLTAPCKRVSFRRDLRSKLATSRRRAHAHRAR